MKYLILLLISMQALADVSLSIGAGQNITLRNGTPFERAAALGYEFRLNHDLFLRPEVGWFMDNAGHGGLSSFWAAPIFGVRALSDVGPELHVGIGPGYLQNPDAILGGHFQFALEGGLGLLSSGGGSYVGLSWKHLSSAGFEMPNRGRDFVCVNVRLMNF